MNETSDNEKPEKAKDAQQQVVESNKKNSETEERQLKDCSI